MSYKTELNIKRIMLAIFIIAGIKSIAFGETYHKTVPAGGVDKATATVYALNHKGATFQVCSEKALTKKLTWKNIPAGGTNDFMSEPEKSEEKK